MPMAKQFESQPKGRTMQGMIAAVFKTLVFSLSFMPDSQGDVFGPLHWFVVLPARSARDKPRAARLSPQSSRNGYLRQLGRRHWGDAVVLTGKLQLSSVQYSAA